MKKIALAIAAGFVAAAIAACSPGTAEKAGENADSAFEETTQGQKDMTDGPMENAGEAIDAAGADAAEAAKDAQNSVEKAIDENTPKDPPK